MSRVTGHAGRASSGLRAERAGVRLAVALVVSAAFFGRGARADGSAETLLHEGVELRKQSRDAEALDVFRRAYALEPSARARAQIALAEQALGHWALAEQGLVQALAQNEDPFIARYRAPLTTALETIRDHLGSLEVETNVQGAAISVDGAGVGISPLGAPLRVEAGTHAIRIEASGHAGVERRVEVPARGVTKAVVFMVAEPPRAPAASRATEELHPGASPAAEAAPPHVSNGGSRILPVLAFAGGGALVATGVVAHVVRESNASVYNDDSRCLQGTLSRDQRCGSYRDRANTAGVVAITAYATGGAALLAGAALLVFDHREGGTDAALRVRASVLPGAAYVACTGAF